MRKLVTQIFLALMFCGIVAAQTQHSITFSWLACKGGDPATGFHVQCGAAHGGPYTVVGTVPVGTLTYVDTAVTAGSTYYCVVTAYNLGGDSVPSKEVSCTIPFAVPAAPGTLSGVAK